MELSEFVSETLKQVFKGIEDYIENQDPKSNYGIVDLVRMDNFGNSFISFDVSVTSSQSVEKGGGIGIKVVDFFNAQGNVDKATSTLNANRIQFQVPVKYPINAFNTKESKFKHVNQR